MTIKTRFPSIEPSLDLNFAATKRLDPRITFTRASSATFVNEDGLIEAAGVNQARFDHTPTTGESLGLLVEEQRTNLLLRSEEFDNASWTQNGVTVTPNASQSPAGGTTADLVAVSSSGGSKSILCNIASLTVASNYTLSFYAKAGASSTVAAGLLNVTFLGLYNFTLTGAGSVSASTAGVSGAITSVGNGWYRCQLTVLTTGVGATLLIYPNSTSNSIGDSIYLWGAQLEAGAFPTSYIPTTSAAATRSADLASITGSALTSFYNQSEGVMFASGDYAALGANGFPRIVGFTGANTGTDEISLYTRVAVGTGDGTIFGSVTVNSVLEGNLDGPLGLPNLSAGYRSAIAYKANDFGLSSNGLTPTVDTSGTLPTITQLIIMGNVRFQNRLSGHIRRLAYWPTRLNNNILQQITQ